MPSLTVWEKMFWQFLIKQILFKLSLYIYICHIIHSELNECEVVIIAEILFIRKCTVGNIVSINNDSRGGIMTFSLW